MHRLAAVGMLFFAGAILISNPALRRWRAAELLLALSAGSASAHQDHGTPRVVEENLSIVGRSGPIRARIYRAADSVRAHGLVLSHGVHYRGIDERRLVPFARELAAAGLVVLTPELDDLIDYRITRRGLDVITDSALWLGKRADLVASTQVGLLGFSFAGGLSLVAAAEPELNGRLAYVTSVGGHHDLARVLSFLLTDEIDAPDGRHHSPAHEYGLVVLLYQNLDEFVPEADRELMRASVRAWLQEDFDRSAAIASLRTTRGAEELFSLMQNRQLKVLAPRLRELALAHTAELELLSPRGKLSRIGVPVYLLHGSSDSVIPPSETEWASRELGSHDHTALVSPLLEHVEVNKAASVLQQVALVDFMAKML
jgi:dienelactone hydrolase